MAGAFSAIFGTPLAATIFTLEVVDVGSMQYAALLPCLVSALLGFFILHQIPTVRTFIGGGLVVLASLLLFFYKKRWLKTNDSSAG